MSLLQSGDPPERCGMREMWQSHSRFGSDIRWQRRTSQPVICTVDPFNW
jgi:hypothetical protein